MTTQIETLPAARIADGVYPVNVGLTMLEKWLVECAAAREGVSVREFITRCAVEAAHRVIEEEPRRRR